MSSPIGYAVFRRNGLDAHNAKLKSRGVMFLQDAAGAESFARDNPDMQVAYRQVTKTDGVIEAQLHRHPGLMLKYAKARAVEVGAHIWINVGCEPDTSEPGDVPNLARETLEVAKWAIASKRRVILLHLAHYGFGREQWLQLAELMRYASGTSKDASGETVNHRDYIIIGLDEYGAVHTFSGVVDPRFPPDSERGHIDPAHWVKSSVGKYYHCGRVWDLLNLLTELGIPWPRIWITEHGVDALNDVTPWRKSHPLTSPYDDIRGYKSCRVAYEGYYNNPRSPYNRNWPPGKAFARMVIAAHQEIYAPSYNPDTKAGVEVVLVYCWDFLEDWTWQQFSVADDQDFQDEIVTYQPESGVPLVTTIPKPTTPPVEAMLIRVPLTFVNVRAQPSGASADVGDLYPNTKVRYYPDSITNQFVYIETVDKTPAVEGWVSLQNGAVVFEVVNPDAPAFVLGNPVAFKWRYSDRFNAPRNYSAIAPTRLQKHEGVDVIPVAGEPGPYFVIAAQTGVVESVGNDDDGYGQYVRLRHDWYGQTYKTWYAHLKTGSIVVRAGDTVTTGATLGEMGATGYVSGPHLHFTLQHIGHGLSNYVVDDVVDPEPVLPAPPSAEEPPIEEPPEPEAPPVVTPIDVLKEQVWAALDAWMEADKAAGEAIAAASLKAHAFETLYAQYMALKQESAAPELTLVKDAQGEAA